MNIDDYSHIVYCFKTMSIQALDIRMYGPNDVPDELAGKYQMVKIKYNGKFTVSAHIGSKIEIYKSGQTKPVKSMTRPTLKELVNEMMKL